MVAEKNVAGVILAAGGSKRMGVPKQLLAWNNRPFIVNLIETALSTKLSPVLIVLGAQKEKIEPIIHDYPVIILNNPDWKKGMSTSIKVAIRNLPPHINGLLFLLGDQPQISRLLIDKIYSSFQTTDKPIVAPYVGEKRGNPVLFARELFDELLKLKGDSGGRSIINRYSPEPVKWEDPFILQDFDIQEDYIKLSKAFRGEK